VTSGQCSGGEITPIANTPDVNSGAPNHAADLAFDRVIRSERTRRADPRTSFSLRKHHRPTVRAWLR
jgi:hypothetical protein